MAEDWTQVVATVKAAWLCNATVADNNWAARQLEALSNFCLKHRDEIIALLTRVSDHPALIWERELAVLQFDIIEHFNSLQSDKDKTSLNVKFKRPYELSKPRGVSLIICQTNNPLRYALAPLAASIAARNAVVLASPAKDDVLARIWEIARQYLDGFALHYAGVITTEEANVVDIDHVLICGSSPSKWSNLLSSIPSTIVPSHTKRNVVVLNEGKSFNSAIGQQILANLRVTGRPFDGVDAIFVHSSKFDALEQSILQAAVGGEKQLKSKANISVVGNVRTKSLDLTQIIAMEDQVGDLELTLAKAQQDRAIVLLKFGSLEQVIDGINRLHDVGHLTVLDSEAKGVIAYIESSTSSTSFSTLAIPGTIPAITGLPIDDASKTLFASEIFATRRLIQNGDARREIATIQDARNAYETSLPILKPEHPGGRIDFFVQVEYVVKTTAAILGLAAITASYYGLKFVMDKRR